MAEVVTISHLDRATHRCGAVGGEVLLVGGIVFHGKHGTVAATNLTPKAVQPR